MNQFSPAKLHQSKWTATQPRNREKHFIVTRVLRNENDKVVRCLIEAIHSGREQLIDWQELRNRENWLQGWQ